MVKLMSMILGHSFFRHVNKHKLDALKYTSKCSDPLVYRPLFTWEYTRDELEQFTEDELQRLTDAYHLDLTIFDRI